PSRGAAELARVGSQLAGKKCSELTRPTGWGRRGTELSSGDTGHSDQVRTSIATRTVAPGRDPDRGGKYAWGKAPGSRYWYRAIFAALFGNQSRTAARNPAAQKPYSKRAFRRNRLSDLNALGGVFRAAIFPRAIGCARAEKLLVLTSSEDRARSMSEHFFCDAPFHQSSQPPPTVRDHHDQIRG